MNKKEFLREALVFAIGIGGMILIGILISIIV
jgi:hypothetical protein